VLYPMGTVRDPVFLVFLLCFSSLSNNAIGYCSLCTQDIIHEMMFGRSWCSIQEVFCGNGEVLSNNGVINWLVVKYLPRLNDLNDMSAILLLSPGMLRVVRDEAPESCICMPSNRRRRDTGIDLDVRSLFAHATTEVFSQKTPICLNMRSSVMPSRTN